MKKLSSPTMWLNKLWIVTSALILSLMNPSCSALKNTLEGWSKKIVSTIPNDIKEFEKTSVRLSNDTYYGPNEIKDFFAKLDSNALPIIIAGTKKNLDEWNKYHQAQFNRVAEKEKIEFKPAHIVFEGKLFDIDEDDSDARKLIKEQGDIMTSYTKEFTSIPLNSDKFRGESRDTIIARWWKVDNIKEYADNKAIEQASKAVLKEVKEYLNELMIYLRTKYKKGATIGK